MPETCNAAAYIPHNLISVHLDICLQNDIHMALLLTYYVRKVKADSVKANLSHSPKASGNETNVSLEVTDQSAGMTYPAMGYVP